MQLPENRQLPLLDSHSRWNGSASVKGSIRNISVEKDGRCEGDVFFSSTANDIATLAREGHLTDLSVGYKPYSEHTTWIEPGESRMCAGKLYKNEDSKKRLAVRTIWKPYEVSTTPIGADAKAKFRSMYDNNLSKGERNMPIEKTETTTDKPVEKAVDVDKIRAAALKEGAEAEGARILEIQTTCRELKVPEEFIKDFLANRTPAIEARQKIVAEAQRLLTPAPQGGDTRVGKDETDKFRSAAVTGLLLRSGYPLNKIEQKERDAVEKTEFRGSSMQHLARHCLKISGMRGVEYMDNKTVADEIIGLCKRGVSQGTGDFPYILAAAANKFLANAYVETPTTYQQWVGFQPLDDFKQNKLVNMSLFSDVDLWPEGASPEWGKFSEKQEYVTLLKWGKAYTISYEALVNDDKGAFSRLPGAIGGACARKRNRIIYNLLYYGNIAGTAGATVGPTMNEDSTAMFTSGHGNLLSALAPSTTALSAARSALKMIKLPAPDPLAKTQYSNAAIKTIVAATAKESLWNQVLNSEAVWDAATNGAINTQANPLIKNPFKGLGLVVDPILDEFSTTVWYAAADPNQMGHIILATMNGNGAPEIRSEPSNIGSAKGISYEVMDIFAAGASDWRGMCKNAGA
jgi:hypothetical protein